jgi:septum formation protein
VSLILASSSPYRQQLIQKLNLTATIVPPVINETIYANESAQQAAGRLSHEKAMAVALKTSGVIIASDQTAEVGRHILGKPGNVENAIKQLTMCSGQAVTFYTGLCVYSTTTNSLQQDVVPFTVVFRQLSHKEITRYVELEQPFDCAGSFKSEGLGVALFESMSGSDPNALIGLPLIALCNMLRNVGINPLLS